MIARALELDEFLQKNDTQFVIPIYQRNYDWEKKQCEQLLNDIIDAGKNRQPHFVGSIVFIHDGEYTTGVKELVIIDGQQRLTTITLIYVALYHYASNNNTQLAQKIYEQYIINKYADGDHKLKLKPTENNDNDFKAVINNTQLPNTANFSNIIKNYNYFKSCISDSTIDCILAGLQMLMFVEISLNRRDDNAQRIFESMNSTGLDLSQADLIRNYILMERTAEQQKKLYDCFWEYIENNTRIGSIDKLPDFIRDYLTYSKQNIVNKNEVYHTFKKVFPIQGMEELEKLLSDIKQLVIPYGKLIDPIKEADLDIRKEIKNINKLEINTSYPFLMKVYDDYLKNEIDKECFIRILRFIQTFAFRRFILDLPTNTLNKIFMSLYKEIDKQDYEGSLYRRVLGFRGRKRMPNDSEIMVALKDKDIYNSKSKNREYLFEHLENWGNKELYVDLDGNKNITIEHIFPQTPALEWRKELTKEEYINFSQRYLHTIGNLTLSGNNSAMGNKSFLSKRDMNYDNGEQGYAYSKLWLNQDLRTLECWNEETYNQRTNRLTSRFIEIWSLPKIEAGAYDNDEINIFDAEDPSGRTLEYARFFGRKFQSGESTLTYVALYIYVAKKVFEVTPEDFIKDLGEALQISTDRSDFKRSKPLNETYYIETNLKSNEVFKRLKLILSTFNLDDELMIKYIDDNND